ncbi:multiple epidermal growth factor-like domains protein 10 [Mya arenaria]|uniref:multiple epidermal growth factor-like domains protein 10 n=1 Tax=Mya arenaria TaxID=6604 RepID=UPI0022E30477|nr:multiple epidermal growth factor-like domains protein 10 [Mya arenaria]
MVLFKATCASCSGRCQCCVTDRCEDYKGEDQVCVDGCKDGYHQPRCMFPCKGNCQTCRQSDGVCLTCKPGFYGISDNCLNACVHRHCACVETVCDYCLDGFYDVSQHCNSACLKGCTEDKCNDDGTCNCVENFEGNKCDKCVLGKYGELCNNNCINENCMCTNASNCISCRTENTCEHCIPGYFGSECTMPCSKGCFNGTCNRDGTCKCIRYFVSRCLRGCVRNFYADMCDIECPATTTCKPESSSYGGIIGGTVGGAIAMFCVIAAIHIVLFLRRRRQKKRNSSERNRELTLHSPDPYAIEPEMQYQELSVKRLSENQDETYTDLQEATTLTWFNMSLTIEQGNVFMLAWLVPIVAGVAGTLRTGSDFFSICPYEKCTNRDNCHSCKDGSYRFENNCKHNCSVGCDGTACYNNGTCDTCKPYFSGSKCDSCVDGQYGANCSLQCSLGCAGKVCNSRNGTCHCRNYFSGEKCDLCVDGNYGENCSLKCSQGCEENTCNLRDGTCNCSTNYSGEQCENCIRDRYGEGCSKTCSLGCLENTCSSTDGKCDCKEFYTGDRCDVCRDGRNGDHCLNNIESRRPNKTNNFPTGALTGGVIGAVIVFDAAVVIAVLLRRRLSQREAQGHTDEQETTHPGK